MFNLFSVFDLMSFQANYILYLIVFSFMPCFINVNGGISVLNSLIFNYLSNFMHSLSKLFFSNFLFTYFSQMMLFLFIMNYFSVFPFNFPFSSLPSFIFSLSLSSWLIFFITGLIFNLNGMLSHFVPSGSPIVLSLFLFLIELISNLIRPLTLGVRMCANILAGHLLMALLAQAVESFSFMISFYMVLNAVEMFVSLIQSYIFMTLLVLYMSEIK